MEDVLERYERYTHTALTGANNNESQVIHDLNIYIYIYIYIGKWYPRKENKIGSENIPIGLIAMCRCHYTHEWK